MHGSAPEGSGPAEATATRWWLPWIGAALLALGSLASVWWATDTGVNDGLLLNGDEVVAALIPDSFARSAPDVIFPGNAYQGLLEVPAYAVIQALGGGMLAMRLLHQTIWLGALVAWSAATWTILAAHRGPIDRATKGWVLFAVLGLTGVTSMIGWQVWYHVYPGYQVGALLAGLAVLVAAHAAGDEHASALRWASAGVLAGLAVYAQPMHVAGVACVGVLALTVHQRVRTTVAVGAGVLVGATPWLAWVAMNDVSLLDERTRPVQHPEWGYPERLANTARVTAQVVWGDGRVRVDVPGWVLATQVAVAVVTAGLILVGLVVLARSWRRSAALLVGVAVWCFGLPLLSTFSLDVDQRYAVAWWPAFVVLVAAGTLGSVGSSRSTGPLRWAVATRSLLVVAVVGHVSGVVALAVPAIERRVGRPDAVELTEDLGEDLDRCGVDIVAGDYWSVYPAEWGADAEFDVTVVGGMQRLSGLGPRTWAGDLTVAVLGGPGERSAASFAAAVTALHGRGRAGWVDLEHRPTGVEVLVEADRTLPEGCTGASGLSPVP